MNRFVLLILLMAIMPGTTFAQSQNHVSNGSFEQRNNCPTNASQVTSHCTGWRSYSTQTTPDYFNSCNTSTNGVGVPFNFVGYQQPAQGDAYCGFITYVSTGSHFEYLATSIQALQPGAKYSVSVSICLANTVKYATDNIGVFFYDSGPATVSTTSILTVTPQIYYSSYGAITDTQNWVRMTKTFTADSAYDNIVIGAFNNSSNTFTLDTFNTSIPPNFTSYAYYLIDSVVIRILDSFSVVTGNDSNTCANDTFGVGYRVPTDYNSNNSFTAQLSDKNGGFGSPVNIGTKVSDTSGTITCVIPANISPGTGYRVRVIASSPPDTTKNIGPLIRIGNPDSTNISVSNNSPLCEGNTLQFSASTFVSGTTYSWTGPNSFSSSSPNPFISGASPAQNGNYLVTMKWYGCEVTDTSSVTIKPLPAKPVAANNSPLCAGSAINLTASSSTGGVSYSWTGPNSFSSSSQNPTISNSTVNMSGDYIVTADLNGCNRKDTTTVSVKPQPAAVTVSNNGPVCAGDTLKVNSTVSNTGAGYAWAGPNSFTASTQNAAIANAATNATGWYKMTIDLNGCTYKDSTYAIVNAIPATPNISYNNPLCLGETLNLSASTVSGAAYTWNGPGNFSANTQNASRVNMAWNDTGTYTVTTTMNGCLSPAASLKVNINPVPFVVIFPTPGDSLCQGDPVTFTALPNNAGGTPQYRWVVNGQTAGTNSTAFITSTLNNGDIVRCDMTDNSKCSAPYIDQSNDVSVKVLPWLAPSVSISASPNRPLNVDEYVTFTAITTDAGANPKYQWKRNGQDVQGATGSVWSANTLNDNDSISVEIISDYKCPQPTTAVSNGIRVKVLTSVENTAGISGFILYPNPNNGKFVLKGNVLADGEFRIEVINALGQLVYKDEAVTINRLLNKEIRLGHVTNGTYLLKLNSGDHIFTNRFRVER